VAEVRALGLDPLQVLITVSDRLVHLMLHTRCSTPDDAGPG
jgi:hypothetical protein